MQTGTKSVEIGRDNTPIIDGVLDEASWASATLIDDFHQVEPIEYSEPTEPMTVRIYYDNDALYIGARMLDSRIDSINANVLRQGAQFWGDDYFSVVIAPFNDKRNGYRFQLNPNGIRMEMLFLRHLGTGLGLERNLAGCGEYRRRGLDSRDRDSVQDRVV